MLALADTTDPNMLEPVMVPVADTKPPVNTLPPVMFAVAEIVDPTVTPFTALRLLALKLLAV